MCISHRRTGHTINNATNGADAGRDNLQDRAIIAERDADRGAGLQNRRSNGMHVLQEAAR